MPFCSSPRPLSTESDPYTACIYVLTPPPPPLPNASDPVPPPLAAPLTHAPKRQACSRVKRCRPADGGNLVPYSLATAWEPQQDAACGVGPGQGDPDG